MGSSASRPAAPPRRAAPRPPLELPLKQLLRLLRQPDLERLARRHRVLPADDHDLGEHVFQRLGERGVHRGRAADQPAQEPPGTVDPDESQRLRRQRPAAVGRGRADPGEQLRPELPGLGLASSAGARDLVGDLGQHLVPQPAAARSGKRQQLERAVASYHGDGDPRFLGDPDLHVGALSDGHQQTAKIDPLSLGIVAGAVPRTLGPGVRRRGHRGIAQPGPGGRVAEIISPGPGVPAGSLVVLAVLVGSVGLDWLGLVVLLVVFVVVVRGQLIVGRVLVLNAVRCGRICTRAASPSEHLLAPNFRAARLPSPEARCRR